MPRAIRDPNAPLRPMTFSASRIERWINCNRKAGWQYIAGYEDLGTGATDFGVTVHAVLESYKRDGILPNVMTDEGALASEALPHVEDLSFRPQATRRSKGTLSCRVATSGKVTRTCPSLAMCSITKHRATSPNGPKRRTF